MKINIHVSKYGYLVTTWDFALICTGRVASIIQFLTPPKRSLVLVQCDTTLMKSDTHSTDCSINHPPRHHLPPLARYICMLALTLQSAPPLLSRHLWWEAGGPGGGGQRIRRRTEPPSSPAALIAKPYKGAKLSVLIHSRLLSPTSGTLKRHLCWLGNKSHDKLFLFFFLPLNRRVSWYWACSWFIDTVMLWQSKNK